MLNDVELSELESTLLPALERHHLRLLAHGLRTLQQITGRRAGELPDRGAIEAWARHQPVLAADPGFREAFIEQLLSAAEQLSVVAAGRVRPTAGRVSPTPIPASDAQQPLGLELADLVDWALRQADLRLELQPINRRQDAPDPPPG